MKFFSILIILVICFSNSCFSQISKISVERFFETLPNRVYYTERSLITDTEYQFYFPDVDFRRKYNPVLQVFRIPNTNKYSSLFNVNNHFYWVPKLGYEPNEQFKIELPGNYQIELAHNQQPLVSSQQEYEMLRKDLYKFSYDMFLIDYYSDRMDANDNQLAIGFLTLGFGALTYIAFNSESDSKIENIALIGGGILSASYSVGGIVKIFRDRKRFKNYSNKRDEIIQKYNW